MPLCDHYFISTLHRPRTNENISSADLTDKLHKLSAKYTAITLNFSIGKLFHFAHNFGRHFLKLKSFQYFVRFGRMTRSRFVALLFQDFTSGFVVKRREFYFDPQIRTSNFIPRSHKRVLMCHVTRLIWKGFRYSWLIFTHAAHSQAHRYWYVEPIDFLLLISHQFSLFTMESMSPIVTLWEY